jgi:hypothetical protein
VALWLSGTLALWSLAWLGRAPALLRCQRPALPRFVAWRTFSRRRWLTGRPPHGVPMLAARRWLPHDVAAMTVCASLTVSAPSIVVGMARRV